MMKRNFTFLAFLSFISQAALATVVIEADMAKELTKKLNSWHENEYLISSSDDIIINSPISWNNTTSLTLRAQGNIIFNAAGSIQNLLKVKLALEAGMAGRDSNILTQPTSTSKGSIIFKDNENVQVFLPAGEVKVYYNPTNDSSHHKFHNPSYTYFTDHITADTLIPYMLVNTVEDLQDINYNLAGNYALSRNIEFTKPHQESNVHEGEYRGFVPLKDEVHYSQRGRPFSGHFDGTGHIISHLYISLPEEDKVGLFGMCGGSEMDPAVIENVTLIEPTIHGGTYVGGIVGWATYCHIRNVAVYSPTIISKDIAGGIIGTGRISQLTNFRVMNEHITAHEYAGRAAGVTHECDVGLALTNMDLDEMLTEERRPWGSTRVINILNSQSSTTSNLPWIAAARETKEILKSPAR